MHSEHTFSLYMHAIKSPHGNGLTLTGTPGIAEEDEFPDHASPPLALCGDTQLECVTAH